MLRASTLVLVLLVLSACGAAEPEPFVVHEWGVWIRTQANVFDAKQGSKVTSTAAAGNVKTLLGPPAELNDDLPAFVLRHDKTYQPREEARSWRKPIIHLYGPDDLNVVVKVSIPFGKPTAYWPQPVFAERVLWNFGTGVSEVTGLSWSGKLRSAASGKLAAASDGHWWKVLRNVPSKYIETETGTERFLFYEATAVQEQPVKATVAKDALVLKNTGTRNSGTVVVIVNDGKARHCIEVKNLAANDSYSIDKAALEAGDGAEESVLKICRTQWELCGMMPQEAHSIVETWKPDLLNKAGFLVISQMPREIYDTMFPISITPEPAKLVRAGLVFDTAPGENDRLSWLPALRTKLEGWAKELSDDNFDVREQAIQRFSVTGDIASPLIQELAKSDNAAIREAATKVISNWSLPKVVLQKPAEAQPVSK